MRKLEQDMMEMSSSSESSTSASSADSSASSSYGDSDYSVVSIDELSSGGSSPTEVPVASTSVPSTSVPPNAEELSLRQELKLWATECNLRTDHLTKLLKILKRVAPDLPSDGRTIRGRSSKRTPVTTMGSGEYVHIGLQNSLVKQVSQPSVHISGNEIVTYLAIDGLTLYKKRKCYFWPILGRIMEPFVSKIFAVGIYCGKGKPSDVQAFCKPLIRELSFLSRSGLYVESLDRTFDFKLGVIIRDAPARAFIKPIKNVNAY
ncbi:unnamed protein product [Dibothriocephalus latus]|uniref:Uncharacterized protein n=1 Tax=Dibothriocephalus latus TaxID=60516 RepID=A0A3P7N126_DIBLA|nr:unnamed protein product [Dibothriocephalus latus]